MGTRPRKSIRPRRRTDKPTARAPRGGIEIHRILTAAEQLLVESGRYPNVVGVGIGRRRRKGVWTGRRVVTVFVSSKVAHKDLANKHVPRVISIRYKNGVLRLPTDVVAVGSGRGRAQTLAPGDLLRASASNGRVSWVAPGWAVTAEHVTGFTSQGITVSGPDGPLGQVARLGYQVNKVDAVLIQLDAGIQITNTAGGRSIGRARYAADSDIYSPATNRNVWVYLPEKGAFQSVALRHIHVGPYFTIVAPDGTEFTPRPLAMTDLCTHAGDSGTILLGADNRPIALLSGIVDAADGQSYSCFTELGPALDALQIDW